MLTSALPSRRGVTGDVALVRFGSHKRRSKSATVGRADAGPHGSSCQCCKVKFLLANAALSDARRSSAVIARNRSRPGS